MIFFVLLFYFDVFLFFELTFCTYFDGFFIYFLFLQVYLTVGIF